MTAKPGTLIGLEFDHLSIRAARLSTDGKGNHTIESLLDVTGNFAEDADLNGGLKQIRDQLRIGPKDQLASCLSGKQVSVSQITFRDLPAEEMEQALKLEMRKSIPFEIAGATIDFQVLESAAPKSETVQVLVAIAGAGLLSRHLNVLDKSGLAPTVVDVLPLAAGNALWSWVGSPKNDAPHVAVHIGPQISTIVIDGAKTPFFNRYVYFAAEDFVGRESGSTDLDKRVQSLCEEIARSLAFYEKSTFATGFQEIALMGEYLDTTNLVERLRRQTGLGVRRVDLAKKLGFDHDKPAGRFDLAVALAMRAGED